MKNKDIDRTELIQLYEIYNKMLTVKQRDIFELYYYEDYSLFEIVTITKTSRTTTMKSK